MRDDYALGSKADAEVLERFGIRRSQVKGRRFYDSPQWRRLSKAHLAAYPHCVVRGCDRKAVHADHIVSVRAAPHLALEPRNLQSLCHTHHSALTRAYEAGRLGGACDADGRPLDPAHPWAQQSNADAIRVANGSAHRSAPDLGALLKAAYVRGDRR